LPVSFACRRSLDCPTGIITDDPNGFHMEPEMLALHDRAFEVALFPLEIPSVNHEGVG